MYQLLMPGSGLIAYLSLIFLILFPSCAPSDKELAQQRMRQQQLQSQVAETTPKFSEQVSRLVDNYFNLKNALVESNVQSANKHSNSINLGLQSMSPEDLNEQSEALWQAYNKSISDVTKTLMKQDDIESQRYHFEDLSEIMIELVHTFQPLDYVVYHQSCPMVRGGSADWLSREEQISNPYHGDRMLRCGEIIARI